MRLPLWGRRNRDAQLEEEIRSHFQMAIRDRIDRGETAEQAEASVRREFGNVGLVKEVTREFWGWSTFEQLVQDLRFGTRMLIKNPGFSLIAILTLALGIGANTAMFSVLNVYLFRDLPYPQPERLVQLFRTSIDSNNSSHSVADFLDQREKNRVFEEMAAFRYSRPALVEGGEPAETLNGLDVTAAFFPTMGVQAALGRFIAPEEDLPGANMVAVLSDRFWQSRYGGDPDILGRTLRLDGQSVKVIGVMPPGFEQPMLWGNVDFWRPMAFTAEQRQDRVTHFLGAIARLKTGVSPAQAQVSMVALTAGIAEANASKREESFRLQTLQNSMSNDTWRKVVWFTFGLAVLVLLIACVNLANLQLVRTAARSREHAMRAALGAGRVRLLRQLLTESLLISFLGGALSWCFAMGGVEFISNHLFSEMKGARVPIDLTVFGFSFLCSVLTGLIFGAVPAWFASRADVNQVLKENLRGSSTSSHSRLRHVLIAGEVALALALLTGAGLFLRGVQRLNQRDPGWQIDGLLTARLFLQGDKYETPSERGAFYQRLEERLRALPGVQQVSLSHSQPVYGFNAIRDIIVEGQPESTPGQLEAYVEPVSTQYFQTFGIRLLAGRAFTHADRANSSEVIIINQAIAQHFWPGGNPIGKRIKEPGPDRPWREIVGVVNDVGSPGQLDAAALRFQMFRPLAQAPWSLATIALRTSAPPDAMANELRRAVAEIDPNQPVNQIRSARTLVEQSLGSLSLLGSLLGAFAALGLVLAAIGIYGVISYSVAQRTGEIGVRMALGAQTGDVLWLVMGKGTRQILIGAVAGIGGGYAVSRLLTAVIPAMPTRDPVVMAVISLILIAVALIACYLPARRATKVDPMVALRNEGLFKSS
jgi:putative ABC transport system permease protein